MPGVDTTCVTHSYACDCREAKFSALEAENAALKARVEKLRGALERYVQIGKWDSCSLIDYTKIGLAALEADKPSS